MFDLKAIRETPDLFDKGWAKRGLDAQTPEILKQDEVLRSLKTRVQDVQSRRNDASKEIGKAKASGDEAAAQKLIDEVATLKDELQQGEDQIRDLETALHDLLAGLPNIPHDDVPEGEDEDDNVEIRKEGTPRNDMNSAQEHWDMGERSGLMDFDRAARISGSRFVYVRGQLARLERALGQFMLNLHTTEFGYEEVQPPMLVRDEAFYGTGQLPKFAEDSFRTENGYWLIPTAEVSLTNIMNSEIIDDEELPLRLTALTPCFRSEAGAAGRDTRGMIRMHQFNKVELVSLTTPDQGLAEHDRMTACAEEVLKQLELPYRVMVLCAGDMGFSARKTHDLEVWLPGQGTYREISSVSHCGDFQARRMNTRCRKAGDKATRFVHTLNGSGLAVGRALIAVMENYQGQNGGSITVPDALKPYMGGVELIDLGDS